MKIGIEAQRIFRKKKHGMDIVALELIRNLQLTDQHNQYVVFAKDDEDNDILKESDNLKIVKIPGGPYPYWEQVLLPAQVRKHEVELLHCTGNTAPQGIDVPVVLTLHDIIYLERWNFTQGTPYQIVGNLYRRWIVPRVVRKAAKILTVSNFEAERIRGHFNLRPGKVDVVYNGVGNHFKRITAPKELEEVRRKYQLPDNFVFFLGNTDPKKNVTGVLRALSILRKSGRLSFRLLMLDIDRNYLNAEAAKIGDTEILAHITFAGYVPNHELPAIYSLADLFIYPSLRESFGIPMLEAMACGTPVLTSDVSSMPEVAKDAAQLIDPTDPASIAEGIVSILSDKELRARLSVRGLTRSAEFSWMENARKTLAKYESVLATREA